MNIKQDQDSQQLPIVEDHLSSHLLLRDVNEWIENINSQQKSININCCGGDEKKNATKNQVNTLSMMKETVGYTQTLPDPMEADDQQIQNIVQQYAPKVEIDDDLKDLFDKKEITQAIINQLTQRALTGSMNSNNDDPARLCTKKHVRN
jgi:hypothetical protein